MENASLSRQVNLPISKEALDGLLEDARVNNEIEGHRTTDAEHAEVRRAAHLKYRGVEPDAADPV